MGCHVASLLAMNSPVIANAVKQSMTSECMDRHASLAMTVHGQCAMPMPAGLTALAAAGSAVLLPVGRVACGAVPFHS